MANAEPGATGQSRFRLPSTNVDQGPITQTPPAAMTKPPRGLIVTVAVYAVALVVMVVAIAVLKSPS